MSEKPSSEEKQTDQESNATDLVDRKDVVYKLRDLKDNMVDAWKSIFEENDYFNGRFEVHVH